MIWGLTEEVIGSIREIFSRQPKIREVILFGSRAKGNYKQGSDIDLVILDDDISFNEMLDLEAHIEKLGLLYKIDLQRRSKIKDADVLDHIERMGVGFYERRE